MVLITHDARGQAANAVGCRRLKSDSEPDAASTAICSVHVASASRYFGLRNRKAVFMHSALLVTAIGFIKDDTPISSV